MTDPTKPTRQELERLADGDNRTLVALERLFERVGTEMDEGQSTQASALAGLSGRVSAARSLGEAAAVMALTGRDSGASARILAEAALLLAMIPGRPENLAKDYIDLRIAPAGYRERRLRWGDETALVDVLNDVTLHIGQDVYVYGLNSSGVTISKGQGVTSAGVSGGDLLIERSDGSDNGYKALGVAAQDIPNGEYGYVLRYGLLESVDTSGFAAGAWLFFDATTAGALTSTRPNAPSMRGAKAMALDSAASGRMLVKVQDDLKLSELGDVDDSGAADGNALVYQSSDQTWVPADITVDLNNYDLEDLGNVIAGTPVSGNVLYHNGTNWARLTATTGSFTAGSGETVNVFNGFVISIV